MKAVGMHEFGGPEVLQVVELPEPVAGPGEVRVRVHAAAVSPADTLLRSGIQARMLAGLTPPFVPGMDLAGVLDQIGDETDTDLKIGDQVMAMVVPFGAHTGAYAEYVVLPESWVARSPSGVGHEAAATLPMNGLTALLTLDQLALDKGATLAVTGAAGTVGGYLIELAKNAGLFVIADSSQRDEALVRRLGADQVVSRGPGIARTLRALHPDGVDGIADAALVGPGLAFAVRDGGAFADLRDPDDADGYTPHRARGIRIVSPRVPEYAGRADKLNKLRTLVEDGAISLRVAETVPATRAAYAHRRLEAGGVRGRLVLSFVPATGNRTAG